MEISAVEGGQVFKLAFESSPVAIVITDEDGAIVLVNPKAERLFGYAKEEIRGQPIEVLVPERFRKEHVGERNAFLHQPVARPMAQGTKLTARRKDGTEFPVQIALNPLEAGGRRLVLSTVLDLSVRDALLEEVSKKKAEFEALFSSMAVGVSVYGEDGRVLSMNPFALEMMGVERMDLLAPFEKRVQDLELRGEDGELIGPENAPIMRALRGEVVHNCLVQTKLKKGLRWFLVFANPIVHADGSTKGAVASFLDVTERRNSEEALAKNEAKLRAMFDSLVEGVVFLNTDGSVEQMNRAVESVYGLDPKELRDPKQEFRNRFLRPDGTPLPREEQPPFVAMREGRTVQDVEMRLTNSKGELRWRLVNATPVKDAKGKTLGAVVSFVDITDRKRWEMEIESALQREKSARQTAEEANRLKDDFLANVSHEIRTPLNAILGWAHILEVGRLPAERHAAAIQSIMRNARMQARLVDDILDVSRMITGKLKLEIDSVDLRSVVDEVFQSLRPAMDAKNLQVSSHFEPAAATVEGDLKRLQQVIWNLISNAVKFNNPNGEIRVAIRTTGDELTEIVVSDNGLGIDPDFLPHIFERFRQQDSSTTREHGGLGLGLAIVKHLVELHGGRITAESGGAGEGAVFRIVLPRIMKNLPDGAEHRPPRSGTPQVLEDICVLVVDDDPDTIEVLQFALESAGATVLTALSVEEAVKHFEERRCNFVLSDIAMGGENGHALIRRLRQIRGDRFRAIAVTAKALDDDRERALQAGFDEHFAKPVDPMTLVNHLAKLAGNLKE